MAWFWKAAWEPGPGFGLGSEPRFRICKPRMACSWGEEDSPGLSCNAWAHLCYLLTYFSWIAAQSLATFSSEERWAPVLLTRLYLASLQPDNTLQPRPRSPHPHCRPAHDLIKNFHNTHLPGSGLWACLLSLPKAYFVISHHSLTPSLSVNPKGALGLPIYCILFPLKWSKLGFVFVTWVKRTISSDFPHYTVGRDELRWEQKFPNISVLFPFIFTYSMSPLMPKISFNPISNRGAPAMDPLPSANRTHVGKKCLFLLSNASP